MQLSQKLYSQFIIATFALLMACGKASTPAQQETATQKLETPELSIEITEKQFVMTGIALDKISQQNLSNVLKVNGILDVPPQNLVSISAVMGGFIRKTDIIQGMKVQKGQLLAVIENQDFIQIQQDYLDTKAKLEYAELEYKRQEELARENVSAAKIFQQTTADYKSLQAKYKALQQRLHTVDIGIKEVENGKITSEVSIFSPINGYVTAVNFNLGKFVNPVDVLFEIVDTDHLHVELSVFEKDIAKIKIGQKLHFYMANEPEKERKATVYLINPKINPDRTIRVHCHLDQKETELMPNTYVKAFIDVGENTVPALPEDAIVNFEGEDYIWLQEKPHKEAEKHYHFHLLKVQKGMTERGFVEVILPEDFDRQNTQIVTKGANALLSEYKNATGGGEEGHAH
jgi:cobalt-zinc-cadmium efflux system membrane fusion protein